MKKTIVLALVGITLLISGFVLSVSGETKIDKELIATEVFKFIPVCGKCNDTLAAYEEATKKTFNYEIGDYRYYCHKLSTLLCLTCSTEAEIKGSIVTKEVYKNTEYPVGTYFLIKKTHEDGSPRDVICIVDEVKKI